MGLQRLASAEDRIDKAYRDEKWWARTAILNTASSGKFSSDRTIEEYVRDIWHDFANEAEYQQLLDSVAP